MNIEKYTERARGFIQSAQSLAMRDGHQQFSPLHMLKVLLDDSEGLAGGLIAEQHKFAVGLVIAHDVFQCVDAAKGGVGGAVRRGFVRCK